MARLIWAEPALAELDDIAEFIALDNPPAAARLVRRVFDAVAHLKEFPWSGKQSAELPGTPYRELVIPPCRVFYRVEDDNVIILHVLRAERLFRAFVLEDRDADE